MESTRMLADSNPSIVPPFPTRSVQKPNHRKVSRWISFQLWFNAYRKLYILVVSINFTGMVLAVNGTWMYPRRYSGACVLGNLLMAILLRNELFGRLLYIVVNTLFAKWPPLRFRLACTSLLQHLGGIHSGCGTSGFVWLLFRLVIIFTHAERNHPSVLVMAVITSLAVAICIVAALPWVRNTHHDTFEHYHRFVGWFALVSTWAFVVLGDSYDTSTKAWKSEARIFRQQDFWFVLGMTIFITIPWFTIRHVDVQVEIPSTKVAILHFKRGMQQGLLARISRDALLEYHAFGIISEGSHAEKHYLICGAQGDFTQSLINDPPAKRLWTRQLKFAGVSNSSVLYKRGIRVCTGTGLGAALSTCLQSPNWYLIWIGSDQAKTFGPTISGLIHRNIGPERMTL